MVLKRLLVTTLSALGLGALVSGPAFGQAPGDGNIPAPDLFDDQIACSMNVPPLMGTGAVPMPTMVPTGGGPSTLDNLLRGNMGMGDPRTVDLTATDDPDSAGNNPMDLIYVVPASVANCGGPTDGTVVAFTAAANGAIATDVAEGYTAVFNQFELVVAQEGVVANAQTALNQARMAATATNPNTTAINSAQAILDAATEELAKRQSALDAISTGPIYQAGIAEWRASGAVSSAVTNWNMAVTGVTDGSMGALDILDATEYGGTPHQASATHPLVVSGDITAGTVLTGYVALTADPSGTDAASLNNILLATDGSVIIANLRAYVGTGAETGDNFADDGSLLVPMRETLDPDDGNAMEPLPTTATMAVIRADVEAANKVVKALEEAQAKNVNSLLDDIYTEGLRRARLEAAHLNAQWSNAITDSTDLVTDIPDDPATPDTNEAVANTLGEQSIRTRYNAYGEALVKRDNAETALEMAVADRESRTAALINSFTSPGSFYQQLVDRRQALLDAQQNTVNRIVNAGGTPTTAQNEAVDDAREALNDANEVKGNYDALVSDDNNPAVGLVDELAKTGGDDGQALVSAITGNYDATQANEDRLDALLSTGDDGTESGRVKALEDKVTMLEGGDTGGGLDELRTDLDALTAMDDPMTEEDESGAVTMNANDISDLDERVAENESDIGQIEMDLYGTTSGQHGDLAACDATGVINVAACADARSRHNEADITDIGTDIDDVKDKLGQKKEYIENLGTAIGVDPVTGEGTEDGMSRIDMNAEANMKLGERIDGLTAGADTEDTSDDGPITANAMGVAANKQAIMDEAEARGKADMALGERITSEIAAEAKARGDADKAEMEARMKGDADEAAARMAADKAEMEARMKGDADEAAARMAADEVEMNARMAADKAEMDARMMADDALGGRIDAEAMARGDADMALDMRIDGEAMARADGDVMLATAIEQAVAAGAAADMALGGRISSNADAIASNMNSIGQNRSMINDNRNMIGELSDDLDVVRAGVAASMALAGMPAINGRGIAIGVGSYDGESAFAVGFQIQGEQASFKVGVTSSGGETGASAGVGFNF